MLIRFWSSFLATENLHEPVGKTSGYIIIATIESDMGSHHTSLDNSDIVY
jgi:hypothetical protein